MLGGLMSMLVGIVVISVLGITAGALHELANRRRLERIMDEDEVDQWFISSLRKIEQASQVGTDAVEVAREGIHVRITCLPGNGRGVFVKGGDQGVCIEQTITLEGEYEEWFLSSHPKRLHDLYNDRFIVYVSGLMLGMNEGLVLSFGNTSIQLTLSTLIALFVDETASARALSLGRKGARFVLSKIDWDGQRVSLLWWGHNHLKPSSGEIKEALSAFIEVFEKFVAISRGKRGGVARRLYEYGLSKDLLFTVMALRCAPAMIEAREALSALEEEALTLPWGTFQVCMLAIPWAKMIKHLEGEETALLLQLLEDTHDLFSLARKRKLGGDEIYRTNMRSLGALIASRADKSIVDWIKEAPHTSHFVVGARDISSNRLFLCKSFKAHIPVMKSQAMAGYLELAASDPEWNYKEFLACIPPSFSNQEIAAAVARVVEGMAKHQPVAFEDTTLVQLIFHAMRIGRLEDARSLRDRLLEIGNTRYMIEVKNYMAMYTDEMSMEREALFAQLVTAWVSIVEQSAGGLTIASASGGELSLTTEAGALSQAPSEEM